MMKHTFLMVFSLHCASSSDASFSVLILTSSHGLTSLVTTLRNKPCKTNTGEHPEQSDQGVRKCFHMKILLWDLTEVCDHYPLAAFLADLVLQVLEVEDEASVLVLVLWVDVLMQVEQLLFNVMRNGLNLALLQVLHVRCVLTAKTTTNK